MKLFRRFLLGVAALAVLFAILVGIAFTSGFQTWAARKALASQPDVRGSIGAVSAGLQRVEVKDVRIEQAGVVLTLPSAQVDLPLATAGMNKKVAISRLVAKGWVLDLSHPAPAPAAKTVGISPPVSLPRSFSFLPAAYAAGAPAPAAVFRGIFAQLQLPVDLSVDGVDLEGEVILPALPGKPPAHLKVTLRGGGLAAGREGSFLTNLNAVSAAGVAPVSALSVHGTIAVGMDTPRSFTRLSIKAEASASGTQFPSGVKLNTDIDATKNAGGERYALILAGAGKQLARLNADFPLAASAGAAVPKITGTWQLDLRDSDLTPFAMGIPIPTFEAAGEGALDADASFGEIHASGKLTATAEKLGGFQPELAAIGSMRLVADFDVTQRGDTIRVVQLTTDFSSGRPVASVRALQAFEFNAKTGELKVANPALDLLGLNLQGLPLAWAQPFLKDIVLSGGDLQGEFVASARNGGLTLRPKTPLTISNFSVEQTGKPLLRAVDLSVDATADYTPQGWQAAISSLTARSGGATLLTFEAKAGQLAGKDAEQPVKATGRLVLDLPSVLKQPAAAGMVQLTGGEVALDFAVSLSAKQEVQAKLVAINLAADSKLTTEKLPTISTELRADREADGKITLAVPLVVEREGRKSDVNLTGTLMPEKSGFNLDAYLTSALLIVNDVQVLAAPFGGNASPEAPAKTKGPAPEPAPPWAGINGKLTLALKKIVYSDAFEIANVAGVLRLDAGAVKFEGVRAGIGAEGELKADGGLTFDAKAKEPYALAAALTVTNFDTGPLFRAINPTKTPTLEGRFNVASKVAGAGQTIGALAERARGSFDVSSKGGVFRGLAAVVPSDKLQAAQSTLAIVSGFLGGSTAKTVGVASEILKILSEIPFDQLAVTAERDAALNLVLRDFSLIAPDVRLGGAGQIVYTPGKRLLDQTLDMQFSLGTRGRLGELMGQAKLLKPEKDNLGYTAFSAPIKVGGTLDKTDASDLQRKLVNLALEKSGVGGALEKALEKFRGDGK